MANNKFLKYLNRQLPVTKLSCSCRSHFCQK